MGIMPIAGCRSRWNPLMPDERWGRCLECAHWHPNRRHVQALGRCEVLNLDLRGFEGCASFQERVAEQKALPLGVKEGS